MFASFESRCLGKRIAADLLKSLENARREVLLCVVQCGSKGETTVESPMALYVFCSIKTKETRRQTLRWSIDIETGRTGNLSVKWD